MSLQAGRKETVYVKCMCCVYAVLRDARLSAVNLLQFKLHCLKAFSVIKVKVLSQ